MDLSDFVYRPPSTPYLSLIHVDDHIVVVNKPSGLLSVPGRKPEHMDSAWFRASRVYPTVSVVHRLDMATSGILLLARSKAAHKHLSYQFAQRIVNKRYYAVLYGTPEQQQGVIDIPLNVDYPNRPLQKVDWQDGKPSVTCFEIVQSRCNAPAKTLLNSASEALQHGPLVELHPVTGRSHQLRVHMRELGTPILGDRLYSPKESVDAVNRLHLHAQSISFIHPLLGKRMTFSQPIPFSNYIPEPIAQSYEKAKDLLIENDIEVSKIIE